MRFRRKYDKNASTLFADDPRLVRLSADQKVVILFHRNASQKCVNGI